MDSRLRATTVQSDDEINKWFEGNLSVFLRGKSDFDINVYRDENWYFVNVPVNCLYPWVTTTTNTIMPPPQQDNNNNKDSLSFNHSRRHTFPANLIMSFIAVSQQFAELYHAAWAVLGSTIYFFGGTGINDSPDDIYYLERIADGSVISSSIYFISAGCMIKKRRTPKVVTLDGKIYIFGDNDEVFGEVFEPHPNSLQGRSRALSSPISLSGPCEIIFCVAFEKERKIVVAMNYKILDAEATNGTALVAYDVIGDSWVKLDINFSFDLRNPLCQPVAVDSCLYWLDTQIRAYDLNTGQYFEGRIEDDCLFQHLSETPEIDILRVSTLHLVGDLFCVVWIDCHDSRVVHFTTIKAHRTTTTGVQGSHFNLTASFFSCQSFASKLSSFLQDRALIL